ncbi:MAG: Coenzyme F420 hydrogenase/dehydrogenase, beta subunit C-terminal domain [Candidatus Aminicenantes bacterium]|nr:Coenzyme F420 hydrogenase/dehydrogenase, beta subunit C-terminal domain [Candidatus Aminicenantes bacterium]
MAHVNADRCRRCAQCLHVCSGYQGDWDRLNLALFGKIPEDQYLGHYRGCYKGYALDPQLRFQASSGGAVTALAGGLLESGYIQGALVTRVTPGGTNLVESILAESVQEIQQAKTSKYQMAPMDSVLRRLRTFPGRVAVVGLPCQITALRKATMIDGFYEEKIAVLFSLFCGRCPNRLASGYFFKEAHINMARLASFTYRGEGWPGKTIASTIDGETRSFPHLQTWENIFGLDLFTPPACLCCFEFSGEFSDISFGSDWLSNPEPGQQGKSLLLTRSERGADILRHAVSARWLVVEKISADQLKDKYMATLIQHKHHFYLYCRWLAKCPPNGRSQGSPRLSPWDYLVGAGRLVIVQLGKIGLTRAISLAIHSSWIGRIIRKVKRFLVGAMVRWVKRH